MPLRIWMRGKNDLAFSLRIVVAPLLPALLGSADDETAILSLCSPMLGSRRWVVKGKVDVSRVPTRMCMRQPIWWPV